jgi:hypothetical protein
MQEQEAIRDVLRGAKILWLTFFTVFDIVNECLLRSEHHQFMHLFHTGFLRYSTELCREISLSLHALPSLITRFGLDQRLLVSGSPNSGRDTVSLTTAWYGWSARQFIILVVWENPFSPLLWLRRMERFLLHSEISFSVVYCLNVSLILGFIYWRL